METHIFLLISTLIALIIHLAFRGASTQPTKRCKCTVAAEQESTADNDQRSRPAKVFIPNMLARWPWSRRINPHYPDVADESAAWIASFGAFSPKAQHAFDIGNSGLLGCLAHPTLKREHVRACCDLLNLAFIVDEFTDATKPSEVQEKKEAIMDALRNSHKPRPKGEWIGGEVARQFWERTVRIANERLQNRLIKAIDEHLEGVVQQAIDRTENHRIRDIKSYLDVRRETIGVKPMFALIGLPFDIPDDVISHPAIQEMVLTSVDMIILGNDVFSYNVEQFRGDEHHNIIAIIMKKIGTDANGAVLWVQNYHTELETRFHAAMAALPQWEEPLNSQVKEYCDSIGQWVRASDDWSFESRRYFGTKGLEIKEKNWMSLMPKMREPGTREVGPILVDSSLL